jgi:hypothetical protein
MSVKGTEEPPVKAYALPLAFLFVPVLTVWCIQAVLVRLKRVEKHEAWPYAVALILSVFALLFGSGIAGEMGVKKTFLPIQHYPGHQYYIGQNMQETAYLVWVKGEKSPRVLPITKTGDQPPTTYPEIESSNDPALVLEAQGEVDWWPGWMMFRFAHDYIDVPATPDSTLAQLRTISDRLQGDGAVIDGFRGTGQPLGDRVTEYNQLVSVYNSLADTVERVGFPGDIPAQYSAK